MKQNIDLNDEIDLKELFLKLWKGKIFIIFFAFVSIFLASMYLQFAEKKYTVEYKLKPVSEVEQKTSLSALGGLASIAGIQLPSSSTNDFKIFKELIASVEASKIIFSNEELIKEIYAKEWNSSLNSFSKPSRNKAINYISNCIQILIGNHEIDYRPPNPRRLAIYVSKHIAISEDKETGFLNIKSETAKPNTLLSLIFELTEASDNIMRQRYISFSKEPLAFYKEKLRTSRSREHREALAELIGTEEQKLMFASRGKHFIAEPYMKPTISLHPTAPRPLLILVLSLTLGLFFGSILILIRNAIKKEN
jgi:LPS O-antigen subunit length determinant protein (WzzB/FepE family)